MKNVLVIDDDEIFNFLSKKTLQKMGIAKDINTALNGKQALELLNNYYQGAVTGPDVILLDLNMPVLDGFGFMEAFKKLEHPNKEKIMIIVVSSSQDPQDIRRSKALGAKDYISKPLTEHNLRKALED